MLNYSGELMYTVHGFTEYTPGQYSYPAGLSGYGSLFQSNSLIALATSAQREVCRCSAQRRSSSWMCPS